MYNVCIERRHMTKLHSTYRLSEDAKQLMKLMAQRLGLNQTAIMELAIREKAEKMGVKLEKDTENRNASNVVSK